MKKKSGYFNIISSEKNRKKTKKTKNIKPQIYF